MKKLSTAALAALLGTTLLPATAIGFQKVNTNPAAVGLDDETTDSQDEDPFTDAGAEVDADTTDPDNPEITDATTVNPQITDPVTHADKETSDPTVEEENDEAVPGPGDMEEQIDEMNEEESGA